MALRPAPSRPPFSAALRAYFCSGWAFLIPYLAAYLLYWWLRWPVNPVATEGGVKVTSGSLAPALHHSLVPPLLYVYWALHAINAALAIAALIAWVRGQRREIAGERTPADTPTAPGPPTPSIITPAARPAAHPSPSPSLSLSLRVAPWLLLALIFWIPGVYLEWPADPWEHYARTCEWSGMATVRSYAIGSKSSYLLAYSVVGQIAPPLRQIRWFDLYNAGCCLLLSWQYYRLARAAGLGERAAMVFVVLQTLLFGNSIFGFCRYYGMASTLFSQLGAVALARIALEALGAPTVRGADGRGPGAQGSQAALNFASPPPNRPSLVRAGAVAVPLSALVALNHIQGIGIAGLEIAAVVVWRLIAWRRSMIWWLAAAAIAANVAVALWWPRAAIVDRDFASQGWFSAWHGFNLLSPASPAFGRAVAILGVLGVANLGAGLILLARNHVVGWLTVVPPLALGLPLLAIPFANAVAAREALDILAFHRFLLAVPAGLALVVLGDRWGWRLTDRRREEAAPDSIPAPAGPPRAGDEPASRPPGPPAAPFGRPSSAPAPAYGLLLGGALALVLMPAGGPYFGRLWHVLSVPPRDLQLQPVLAAAETASAQIRSAERARLAGTAEVDNVLGTISPRVFPYCDRTIGQASTRAITEAIAVALSSGPVTSRPSLTRDPWAADPGAWVTLGGAPVEFTAGISDFRAIPTALQNPPGRASEVFTSEFLPIDPGQSYRLEFSVRQHRGPRATTYLAVAWYDGQDRLLIANAQAPAGAGFPAGWTNGTYSYFGLVGAAAPTSWTTYRTSFGPGEAAAIPPRARFVRVGALLNFDAVPAAVVQATDVRLWRKSESEMVADGTFSASDRLFIVAPSGSVLWSPASQAGQLSHHWPAQQVAAGLGGGSELAAVARRAGGTPIDAQGMIFELAEPRRP